MEALLHRYVDRLGWIMVVVFLALIIYLK
jgi:hypothetical protein